MSLVISCILAPRFFSGSLVEAWWSVVSALDCQSESHWFEPGLYHCVVSKKRQKT